MRQNTAVFFLLSSVLAYSIFPLIGTHAVIQIHPVLFIGLSHLFALITLTTATAVLLARGRLKKTALRSLTSGHFLRIAAASGIVNAASHASLFASFIYISSASATALYEVWPAAVVMFIAHLLPRHYIRLKLRQWIFVGMAIAGVALLIKSAVASGADSSRSTASIAAGVSLALLSAALMALSSGLDVSLARQLDIIAAPFVQPILSQNVVKVFSATCTIVAYFLFFRSSIHPTLVDSAVIGMAAGTGIFVSICLPSSGPRIGQKTSPFNSFSDRQRSPEFLPVGDHLALRSSFPCSSRRRASIFPWCCSTDSTSGGRRQRRIDLG